MVLVVDDNPRARELIQRHLHWYLKKEGKDVNIQTVSNTVEAINFLKKGKVELVITDIIRENQDSGFIFMHEANKINKDIPFIIMTACAGCLEVQNNGLESISPAPSYIDKNDANNPFEILYQKVNAALA